MSRHCVAASLTRRDRQILCIIWRQEMSSIRSILEALPVDGKPAYTTIQTIVHRLARKGAVRRASRRQKADLFVAAIARDTVVRQWIDDCMALAEPPAAGMCGAAPHSP
jgi:predicted transcriptional regulator